MDISYVNILTVLLVVSQLFGLGGMSWWYVLFPSILYLLIILTAFISAVVLSKFLENY